MQATAALALGPDASLSIEQVDLADPRADEILVRLVATGLCHTDLIMLHNPQVPRPALMGHEGAGIVEAVGAEVIGLLPGDHVLLVPDSCGTCPSCLNGEPSYCRQFQALNWSGGFGGGEDGGGCACTHQGKPVYARFLGQSSFASHVVASARSVVKIDPGLPLDVIAPLGCGIQTGAGAVINTLGARAGQSIAVFGAGAVGLAAVMAAKLAGCSTIIAIDVIDHRLALARELGATHTLNAATCDPVAEIMALCGGADGVVEASGRTEVMEQAIRALGYRGTAVLVGATLGKPVQLEPAHLQIGGRSVKGTILAGDHAVPALFIAQLIGYWQAGRFPFDRLIQHYDFADINTAIADAHSGASIKPVLRLPA